MARAVIRKDPDPDPVFCWYYNVDTDHGDVIDYGSQASWREALGSVEYVLTHRAEFDNHLEA